MKTPEDEAFDDLAKKLSFCSGFQTKPWNEDEWRRNEWRCRHGWLRGEQCEICNAPKREWVGLTEEDMRVVMEEESCSYIAGAKWAEEILKGKNT